MISNKNNSRSPGYFDKSKQDADSSFFENPDQLSQNNLSLVIDNNSNEDDGSIFDQSSPGLISRKKNKLGLSLAHNKSTLLA